MKKLNGVLNLPGCTVRLNRIKKASAFLQELLNKLNIANIYYESE